MVNRNKYKKLLIVVVVIVLLISGSIGSFAEYVVEILHNEDSVEGEIVELLEETDEEREELSENVQEEKEVDQSEESEEEVKEERLVRRTFADMEIDSEESEGEEEEEEEPEQRIKIVLDNMNESEADNGYSYEDDVVTFNANAKGKKYLVTQEEPKVSTGRIIAVNASTDIEIRDVNISSTTNTALGIADKVSLNLKISGKCTLKGMGGKIDTTNTANTVIGYPGITVKAGRTLTIYGEGELTVQGGVVSAAIGTQGVKASPGNKTSPEKMGTLVVDGNVTLIASAVSRGTGIGGGGGFSYNVGGAGGTVIINGGTVIATGSIGGTGIGGGAGAAGGGAGGSLTVNGGTVIASVNQQGAKNQWGTAIGGGGITTSGEKKTGAGGSFTANGGTVIAIGGKDGGAGIGAGVNDAGTEYGDNAGTISIGKNAEVMSYSRDRGYAIQATANSQPVEDRAYVFQGNLNAAINQAVNIDVIDINTEEVLKTLELPASYRGYAYTTGGESHANYNVISSTATGQELGIFAKTADNDIELQSVSSFARTGVKLVQYLVKGKLWHDKDRDGYISAGEPGLDSQRVIIEKYNVESDSYVTYKTATTDSEGNYSAAVYPGKYRMKFPDPDEMVGVTEKTANIKYISATESMANQDLYSEEFEIVAKEVTNLPVIMNAGYLRPNTDNNLFFNKSVKDNDIGSYEYSYGTNDLKETMQFKLEYTLPDDMACYYDLKLQDKLPDELELAYTDVDKAVKVYIDGVPVAGTDGRLTYDETKRIITYQFYKKDDTIDGEYTPYSWLAGKTIRMEVETVFNQEILEEKIDTAVNKGEIIINEEINKTIRITKDENEEEVKAEVYLKGTIKGIAFLDMNKNGVYDKQDKLQQNLEVVLYDAEDDSAVNTKRTGTDGSYEFKVDLDKEYYIGMPKTSGPIALVEPKYSDADGSHLDQDTGLSETKTAVTGNRMITVNGGYELEYNIPDFLYQIKASTGYEQEKEVLEPSDALEYKMNAIMPEQEDLEKYDTLVIQTILDQGLALIDNADIKTIVSISGVDSSDLSDFGTLEYIAAEHKLVFTVDDSKIEELAKKTIEIKFSMQIKQDIAGYPTDGFVNVGEIIINGWTMSPELGNPAAKVKGIISGETFDDRTDAPETGVDVELYKAIGGVFRYQDAVPTDSKGEYQFIVDMDADYQIKFPVMQGNKGLIMPRSANGTKKASHPAVADGYTSEIHVDDYDEYLLDAQSQARDDGSRYREADAGYANPDTDNLGFEKLVLDSDKDTYGETVTITDKNQKIEFMLTFQLPQDMEGYQSIALEDILPSGLVPYTGNKSDDVKVEILDKNGSSTNHIVYQEKLSLSNNKISYVLDAGAYVFTDLAEHQIKMLVYTKLDPAITDYSSLKLVNKGNLTINKWEDEDGQEIGVKSKITGTLFDDDKVNRNGDYDAGEEIKRTDPVKVVLYPIGADGKPDQAKKQEYGSTDGMYSFWVETGTSYLVEFLPILEIDGAYKGLFTPQQVQVDVKDLEHIVNAGYANAIVDEDAMQFSKTGRNGVSSIKITEAGEKVSFDISFYLPGDLNGYQTIDIQDILPKELKPSYESDPADAAVVKAYIDGDSNGLALNGTALYSNNTYTYTLSDLSALRTYAAGQAVYIVMTLETEVTAMPEGSITNSSKLIVNGDEKSKIPGDDGDGDSKVIIDPDTGGPAPDIDEKFIDLRKKSINADGTYANSVEINNPNDELRFAIAFQLPADLTGYKSIEIQDVLPADGSLVLYDSNDFTKAVNVKAEAGGQTKMLTGKVSYNNKILSFYTEDIKGLEDFAKGREMTITMEVILRLKDKDGVYTSDIKNKAKLIINQENEIDKDGDGKEPDVDITLKGRIQGTVFGDVNGNAALDKDDIGKGGVEVTLWNESGTKKLATTYTDIRGEYAFSVDSGTKYKVLFPTSVDGGGLVDKKSGGIASHAEQSTGFTDLVSTDNTKTGQTVILNAGYEVSNTGIIRGKTFVEDGTSGQNDYVTVTLYKETADGSYQPYKEVTVKLGEDYQFIVEGDAAYKIQFSLQSGKAGLIEPGAPTEKDASHASLTDGFSHRVVINEDNPEGFANAGYAYPEVDEEKIRLQKQVKNGGDYTDSVVLTDREQVLSYRISFMVPQNIKGYQTIEIKDILPEQLELAESLEESVKVFIAGAVTDKGELLGSGREITYTFRYSEDFSLSELAGKEIYMEVDARLKKDISELPKELTNKGVLTINGKEELETKEPEGPKEPEKPELPEKGEFIKQLLDAEGKPVSSLELVNTKNQVITYLVTYKMNSLEYYESILLEDQLDSRFEYVSAKVVMNDTDITTQAGTLEYMLKHHKVTYQFKEPIDKAALANQMITMEIRVRLKENITDYSDIHNNAKLLVNGGKSGGGNETDTDNSGEPPVIEFAFGNIKGYVFIDENNDSLRDKDDTPAKNIAVQLEQWDGTKWILVETTVTDSDGLYEFTKVPYGQYRLKVLSGLLNMKHVMKQAGGNQFNGIGSDVDENGITEGFTIDAANKEWISAAGLEYKEDDGKTGGDKDGGKDDDKQNNGDEEETFMKLPSEEKIKPGESIDYTISGFGNSLGREMKKYSITDIFPAGLHFQSAKVPAFTKGTGLTYEISYITNLQKRKILHSDVPADKAFTFQAPELAKGEYITDLTIRMDSVPDGFGVGDEIVYTCLVDEKPPTQSLVNDAALGFDGKEIYAKNNALQVGGAPKTGDNFDMRAYSVVPILALFIAILCYRYGKRYRIEK